MFVLTFELSIYKMAFLFERQTVLTGNDDNNHCQDDLSAESVCVAQSMHLVFEQPTSSAADSLQDAHAEQVRSPSAIGRHCALVTLV